MAWSERWIHAEKVTSWSLNNLNLCSLFSKNTHERKAKLLPLGALLFRNTKPFSLLLFEFESCCWGLVLLYQVGWGMFCLERSVAAVWFGFAWGQDALTGKQTWGIPAEIWNRSVSCWDCSVHPVYHRVPLMEKCSFTHGNTQLLGGYLGCWGQLKYWCQWPWELINQGC